MSVLRRFCVDLFPCHRQIHRNDVNIKSSFCSALSPAPLPDDITALAAQPSQSQVSYDKKIEFSSVKLNMLKNNTETSEHEEEAFQANIQSSNVSEVINFFVFCYMFINLLLSNIATWTIRLRGYKRSLPDLRINIILILNSFLVETFNVIVSITVNQFKF